MCNIPIYFCNICMKHVQHTSETSETIETYVCNIRFQRSTSTCCSGEWRLVSVWSLSKAVAQRRLEAVATRRGCTMRKGGIGLATRLGGRGHMTERGQQHAAHSRASSRVSSTSCLVGLGAECYASEAARWPSVVAHEQLPSGLVAFAPPQACLCAKHVPRSSPASTSSPAWLAGLVSSCTSDCPRRARWPPHRRELASVQTAC
jgi:hypothetical protein